MGRIGLSLIPGLWIAVVVFLALFAGTLHLPDPLQLDLGGRLQPPEARHWLGTDELGRDLLSRIAHAARFTLIVTAGATVISLTLGLVLGLSAAWFGGWLDRGVGTVINLLWSVPFTVLVILFVAVTGASTLSLILVIGGVNWVGSARVFRAETLRLRRSDFIRASRAAGFPPARILLTQVFPNLRAATVTLVGFAAVETLTLEAGLAFLGLSLRPPLPTWGGMVADGLAQLSTAWWIPAVPAAAITLTLASIRALTSIPAATRNGAA